MFVAAMNPCPCGNYNNPKTPCTCGPGMVQRYLNKVSGPLMDRIDIHVEVVPVSHAELASIVPVEQSSKIRERVIAARTIQRNRFEHVQNIFCNAQMSSKMVRTYCTLSKEGEERLKIAMEKLGLSARAYDRILKVARTIADLDNWQNIELEHLSEAINFRSLDRDSWGK
jgi:magnesium chelatase family protein